MAGLKRRGTSNDEERKPIALLDEGDYEGRLVYVADLGLQVNEYKGEVKQPTQQISLGIEIIGESVMIDDVERPRLMFTKPFNIFNKLTEKGNELKYLRIFNPKAVEGVVGDWEAVLDTPVNVTVVNTTNGDNTYNNIGLLAPIPAKYQGSVGKSTITPAIGDADDEENVVTQSLFGLSKFVFDKRLPSQSDDVPF